MEYKHCVNARTEAQSSYNSIMRQKYHISPDFMASSINVRRHHANLASSVIATFRHDPLALGVIKRAMFVNKVNRMQSRVHTSRPYSAVVMEGFQGDPV